MPNSGGPPQDWVRDTSGNQWDALVGIDDRRCDPYMKIDYSGDTTAWQ